MEVSYCPLGESIILKDLVYYCMVYFVAGITVSCMAQKHCKHHSFSIKISYWVLRIIVVIEFCGILFRPVERTAARRRNTHFLSRFSTGNQASSSGLSLTVLMSIVALQGSQLASSLEYHCIVGFCKFVDELSFPSR